MASMDFADKLTEQREKAFIEKLKANYEEAYKNIKKEITETYTKYSVDGKLTMAEMSKYNRLKNLEKQISAELAKLNQGTYPMHQSYLSNVFEDNYYIQGWVMESETAKNISYGTLNRNAIYKSVLTPMDKIALTDNAKSVGSAINRTITQGIMQGQGVREISRGIKKDLENNANNALRIAQTETTRITNNARLSSMEYAQAKGFKIEKKWLTGQDSKVRSSHARLNNDTEPLDEPFQNGLMYPGDPSGSASEIINCRCTIRNVITEVDENGQDVEIYGKYTKWKQERVGKQKVTPII